MAGILKTLERSRMLQRLGLAGSGNGKAKSPRAKKAPASSGAKLEIAISKRNARPVLRTLENVGDQLNGRAAMIESGAVDGPASEARELRAQAKHIETMRYALAGAL